MSKSTPTPWATDPDDRPGMEWNIFIVRADDREARIAFMTSDGPASENAALIVKAVNAFEPMREALRKIADLIDSEADEPLDDAISIANAALAQTEHLDV